MFTLKKAQWTRVQATRMLLSQLAEDAIKRINFDEVQAMNHAQCLERNTAVLVSTSLASKEHRHIEIDASTETTARVEEVKNRNATRHRYAAAPTAQANTIDFRWIKCPRRKQTWSSLSPDQGNFPVADLELLDYVELRGIGVDESDVFAKNAVIFYESNIIVRADTDDRWYAGLFFYFGLHLRPLCYYEPIYCPFILLNPVRYHLFAFKTCWREVASLCSTHVIQ